MAQRIKKKTGLCLLISDVGATHWHTERVLVLPKKNFWYVHVYGIETGGGIHMRESMKLSDSVIVSWLYSLLYGG